jgi:MoxR-like ATPase
MPDLTEAEVSALLARLPLLRAELAKAIIGQQAVVEELLTAFVAGCSFVLSPKPSSSRFTASNSRPT